MHSSSGLFWSGTDDDWTSAPCVDTLLEAGTIRNLISAANMSQTTWFEYLGKVSCRGPSSVDRLTFHPWPLTLTSTSVFVLKIQAFPRRLSPDNLLFEWRISLWFPRAPAGLHCSVKPSRERLYLGCQPARRPSGGVVVVLVRTRGFLRPC